MLALPKVQAEYTWAMSEETLWFAVRCLFKKKKWKVTMSHKEFATMILHSSSYWPGQKKNDDSLILSSLSVFLATLNVSEGVHAETRIDKVSLFVQLFTLSSVWTELFSAPPPFKPTFAWLAVSCKQKVETGAERGFLREPRWGYQLICWGWTQGSLKTWFNMLKKTLLPRAEQEEKQTSKQPRTGDFWSMVDGCFQSFFLKL